MTSSSLQVSNEDVWLFCLDVLVKNHDVFAYRARFWVSLHMISIWLLAKCSTNILEDSDHLLCINLTQLISHPKTRPKFTLLDSRTTAYRTSVFSMLCRAVLPIDWSRVILGKLFLDLYFSSNAITWIFGHFLLFPNHPLQSRIFFPLRIYCVLFP